MINLIVKCSSNQEKNAFISRFHSALTGSAAYVDSQITLLDADDDSLSLIIGSSNNGNLTMTVKAGDLAINFDLLASFNKKHDEDTEAHISLDISLSIALGVTTHIVEAFTPCIHDVKKENLYFKLDTGEVFSISDVCADLINESDSYWCEWFSALWKEQRDQMKYPDGYSKKLYFYDLDGNEYYYVKTSLARVYTRDEG